MEKGVELRRSDKGVELRRSDKGVERRGDKIICKYRLPFVLLLLMYYFFCNLIQRVPDLRFRPHRSDPTVTSSSNYTILFKLLATAARRPSLPSDGSVVEVCHCRMSIRIEEI